MPVVDVVDLKNTKVGSVELNDSVFAAEPNQALIYEAVRHYQAGERAGTAKTKVRREVAGSGKKLWKQKGTGRARVGSVRSPIWRHGGTVHGPVPRDYSYRLNKKMLTGALRSALSAKLAAGELVVVDQFAFAEAKAKQVRAALDALEVNRTALLIDNSGDRNLELGSRNLEGVTLLATQEVTVYHLLGHKKVLVSQAAATKLSEALAK